MSDTAESPRPQRKGKMNAFVLTKASEANEVHTMERVKGIEPSSQAWEARILPLNHTRTGYRRLLPDA